MSYNISELTEGKGKILPLSIIRYHPFSKDIHTVDELELYDIKSVFSIKIIRLTVFLIDQYCFLVKCFFLIRAVALKHFVDRLVIIPAYFLIGYPAVALGRSDVGVAQ